MAPIYLGRRKKEVLADMPPLSFVSEALSVAGTATGDLFQTLGRLADELDLPSATDNGDLLDVSLLPEVPSPAVATARRELGMLKVPGVVAWVEATGARKTVLFGYHRDALELLFEKLAAAKYQPVMIHGGTTAGNRFMAVEKFQTDPDCRVFIGQITAAGTSITLTAAQEVAIFEPSWMPGENYQAACRVHRIGQRDGVVCRFLMVPGTIDEAIANVSRRKARDIAELFD